MAATTSIPTEAGWADRLHETTVDSVEKWLELSDRLLDWDRSGFVDRAPTPDEARDHEKTFRWVLRLMRLLHTQLADPDVKESALADRVAIRIRQLEDAFQYTHDPLPVAEAEKLLQEVFPE